MKIRDLYKANTPEFSFEFFPPKSVEGEQTLLETAERLKALGPAFFSMTYGAGGSTRSKSLELASRIRSATGVETVSHVTCVGQSKDEVRGVLRQLADLGIENIMALRGDPPRGETAWRPHPDGFHFAYELVEEARRLGDFSVAVAGFPEVHPEAESREADLRHLKFKVDHGADAIVTQLFYANEDFHAFVADARALGISIPIIPGIMPIVSAGQVRRFCALSKSRIPEALDRRLEAVKDDDVAARALGIDYAAEQIRELLDRGTPGIHLYCLNRADMAEEIFAKL